jgi:hypothetical protein
MTPQLHDFPDLMDIKEAATVARRHEQTVRGWCHSGDLRYQQKVKRGPIHIWKGDLLAFLGLPTEGAPTSDLTGAAAPERATVAGPAGSSKSG